MRNIFVASIFVYIFLFGQQLVTLRGDEYRVELVWYLQYSVKSSEGGSFVVEKSHDLKTWVPRAYIESKLKRAHVTKDSIYTTGKKKTFVRARKAVVTSEDLKKDWLSHKIKKYKFRYYVAGDSPSPFFLLEGMVTVENGMVVKVDKVSFASYREDDQKKPDKTHFRTFGQIFDLFEKEKAGSDISYVILSPELKFPEQIKIDRDISVADEGITIHVNDFEILKE
ncbi:MAG: hypothetical protein H8E20_00425 [Verrucomicrobia bacterium]|nr:hypothetical protein [Verrucomicrobiota bacterium]